MNKFFFTYESEISAAYIWISGGSKLDNKYKKGINQILCELLTRGCKSLDNYEISNILDFNGAELYYETTQDGIYLGIKSLTTYFNNVYPLLDLLIKDANLPESEFKKCVDTQINFVLKSRENLFLKTFDNWRKIVYKKHPYSFDSNGYLDTIKNINYDDILNEYEKFKKRKKYLVTNYKINNLNTLKPKIINNINNSQIKKTSSELTKEERFIDFNLSTNQVIIMIGNQTCPHNNKDFQILKLIESYLAFGMSSLLFKTFRERTGLAYDSGVINPVRIENAPFLVYISVSSHKAKKALSLLSDIWKELLTEKISVRELKLARTKLKNSIFTSNQTVEDIILRKVQLIGYCMDPYFDHKFLQSLETISANDINQVSNKYLKKPFISILGESKICNEMKKYWIEKF